MVTTPIAPVIAPMAAMKKMTVLTAAPLSRCSPPGRTRNEDAPASSLALSPERRALDRLGQQHLLGEDEVRAGVVRQLVVVPHRDGVEGAGDLAVAAEDAAAHVDLVDGGVALARRDPVLGRVLGRHHADAVGRAGRRAQRAANALLEAGVFEAVQAV